MTERFNDASAHRDDPDVTARVDAEAIARIAGPLKAAERLDETFDARVMSAVHAEILGRVDAAHAARLREGEERGGWWLRRRKFQISPIAGLALAASFAGIFFLSGTALQLRRHVPTTATRARAAVARTATDTVHIVRFVFRDQAAQSVTLVGDFNSWTKGATHLSRTRSDGTWTISVSLAPGRHEYAFIVEGKNGERWVADPLETTQVDEFGTESSIVEVGTGAEAVESSTSS